MCFHIFTNSGLTSILLRTWLFSAAQRSCTALPCVLLANWARFLLNRSLSIFSSFSFFFSAPGLLFILFKLFRCILACPISISPSAPPSSRPGKASARDSSVATSFLLGRRRLVVFEDDFSIFDTKEECLIFCLSFLDEGKREETSSGLGRVAVGVAVRAARADFARAVVRFFMGAYKVREYKTFTNRSMRNHTIFMWLMVHE